MPHPGNPQKILEFCQWYLPNINPDPNLYSEIEKCINIGRQKTNPSYLPKNDRVSYWIPI